MELGSIFEWWIMRPQWDWRLYPLFLNPKKIMDNFLQISQPFARFEVWRKNFWCKNIWFKIFTCGLTLPDVKASSFMMLLNDESWIESWSRCESTFMCRAINLSFEFVCPENCFDKFMLDQVNPEKIRTRFVRIDLGSIILLRQSSLPNLYRFEHN